MKRNLFLTLIAVSFLMSLGHAQERSRYNTFNQESPVGAKEVKTSSKGFILEPLWEVSMDEVLALQTGWGPVAPRGVATDGNTIFITADNTNGIYQYDFYGNYLGEDVHPDEIGAVDDLSHFDGKFMGGWFTEVIHIWDYENNSYEEGIVTPVSNGYVAWDGENDIIYSTGERNSGYDNPFNVLTGDGELLYSFARQNNHNFSGLAYDPRVPCLWGLSNNTASKNTLVQMALPSGQETGVVIELPDYLTTATNGKPAGGLCMNYLEDEDKYILTGMVTERIVWGMELQMDEPQSVDAEILSIAAPLTKMGLLGDHQIEFRLKNAGTSSISDIPVSCSLDGQTPATFTINETIEAGDFMDVSIPLSVSFNNYNESHLIEISVDYPGDENSDNDTFTYDALSIEPYYYECYSDCGYGDGVLSFQLGDISNMNTGCENNGYSDYTNMSTNLVIGNTYTANVATDGPTQSGYMWIDFNDDKFFDNETELVSDQFWVPWGGLHPAELTIPEGVEPGIYRLRILVEWVVWEPYNPVAQMDMGYGEMEDYTVVITAEAVNSDAGINATTMKTRLQPSELIPNVQVKNFGLLECSFDVTASSGNYSSTVNVSNLASKDTLTVVFDPLNVDNGDYQIEFCTSLANDEVPENDCMTFDFRVCDIDREVSLVEIGTGTWCGFCPGAALGADELVENGHDVAVIEYHSGDSYQISEGIDRLMYYDVAAFPTTIFDGNDRYEGGSATTSIYPQLLPLYENAIDIPSAYSIYFSLDEVESMEFDLSVTVDNPYGFEDENIKLFVVLTESHIPESWGILDEVNFVARAVYPDSEGKEISFNSGNSFNYQLNFTVPENYVLENCRLNIFVQDIETREVWQAKTFGFDLVGIEETHSSHSLSIYPNPATDLINIQSDEEIQEISIYNFSGQLVYKSSMENKTKQIDTQSFTAGLYIVHLITDSEIITEQIIIE